MGSKYRQGVFTLFAVCLVYFSLPLCDRFAVSVSSLFHDTSVAAVALIVDGPPAHGPSGSCSSLSGQPLKSAISQSALSDCPYRFFTLLVKEQITELQQTNLPVVRLISILHKKNGWHQSSQDDPHLRLLSSI